MKSRNSSARTQRKPAPKRLSMLFSRRSRLALRRTRSFSLSASALSRSPNARLAWASIPRRRKRSRSRLRRLLSSSPALTSKSASKLVESDRPLKNGGLTVAVFLRALREPRPPRSVRYGFFAVGIFGIRSEFRGARRKIPSPRLPRGVRPSAGGIIFPSPRGIRRFRIPLRDFAFLPCARCGTPFWRSRTRLP